MCRFIGNRVYSASSGKATGGGLGIYVSSGMSSIMHTMFAENYVGSAGSYRDGGGGGVALFGSNLNIYESMFLDNQAENSYGRQILAVQHSNVSLGHANMSSVYGYDTETYDIYLGSESKFWGCGLMTVEMVSQVSVYGGECWADGNYYPPDGTDGGGDNVQYQHLLLTAPSPSYSDAFGKSVAMNGDGRVIVIGAWNEDVFGVSVTACFVP